MHGQKGSFLLEWSCLHACCLTLGLHAQECMHAARGLTAEIFRSNEQTNKITFKFTIPSIHCMQNNNCLCMIGCNACAWMRDSGCTAKCVSDMHALIVCHKQRVYWPALRTRPSTLCAHLLCSSFLTWFLPPTKKLTGSLMNACACVNSSFPDKTNRRWREQNSL